jgi:hypothetical protein
LPDGRPKLPKFGTGILRRLAVTQLRNYFCNARANSIKQGFHFLPGIYFIKMKKSYQPPPASLSIVGVIIIIQQKKAPAFTPGLRNENIRSLSPDFQLLYRINMTLRV